MSDPSTDTGVTRRSFLRTSTVLAAGAAAVAAGIAPLRKLGQFSSVDEFLQKHYKELTPEEMKTVLSRIETEVERQYGIRPHVRDYKPMNGVEYVYALNLTRCVGCRKCVHACVAENNQSRNPMMPLKRRGETKPRPPVCWVSADALSTVSFRNILPSPTNADYNYSGVRSQNSGVRINRKLEVFRYVFWGQP